MDLAVYVVPGVQLFSLRSAVLPPMTTKSRGPQNQVCGCYLPHGFGDAGTSPRQGGTADRS
jgi:hypothetical protein